MNRDAEQKRKDDLKNLINQQAAVILRNRLCVMPSVDSVKTFMETTSHGLLARTVVIDVTMPGSRQTGAKSRNVSLAPPASEQKTWAAQVKVLPATPVVGHVLVRPAQHSIESLNIELMHTHAHKRSITVPVSVPEEFLRYVRGGLRKAHGPNDDDATGVDFIMRTIGRRAEKTDSTDAVGASGVSGVSGAPQTPDDSTASQSDPDDIPDGDGDGGADASELDRNFQRLVDPTLMTPTQLKAAFGNRALDVNGIFFQHSARITPCATFLRKGDTFMMRAHDRAPMQRYRKGQLHSSVWVRALTSALSSSNVDLSANEALVVLTGGTPEVAVAGIVVGFRKVFVIAPDAKEEQMMALPSEGSEREHQINYNQHLAHH
jgi:hypothetical protein